MTVLLRTRDGQREKRCISCLRWYPIGGRDRGFHRSFRAMAGGVRNDCRECRCAKRNWAEDYRRWCKPWRARKRAERLAA